MKMLGNSLFTRNSVSTCVTAAALWGAAVLPAHAAFIDPSIPIPTELLSFGPDGINGDVFLPLTGAGTTSGEAGAPATVDGYGWVKSNIRIDLSDTTPSTGEARLSVPFDTFPDGAGQRCIEGGQAGNVNDGDTVCVDSFFDVFYDVSITDIDGTAGFFGGMGPMVLAETDIGPAFMQFRGECIADTSQPNLGCLPPEGFPYVGHFEVQMALGVDVNGNLLDDVLKFEFGAHDVGGVTNTFFDGNQVVDEFDSTIAGIGSVVDEGSDPPFSFTLTGPTTAQQQVVYPAQAPEPTSIALLGGGLALIGRLRRRRR